MAGKCESGLQCGQFYQKESDTMANVAYEQALEVVRALSPEELQQLLKQIETERCQSVPPVNDEAETSYYREREMRWLAEHEAEYAGQWLALDGDRLLSQGTDPHQVRASARAQGVAS